MSAEQLETKRKRAILQVNERIDKWKICISARIFTEKSQNLAPQRSEKGGFAALTPLGWRAGARNSMENQQANNLFS